MSSNVEEWQVTWEQSWFSVCMCGVCARIPAPINQAWFFCPLEIQTHMLKLIQQALYPLNHLASPKAVSKQRASRPLFPECRVRSVATGALHPSLVPWGFPAQLGAGLECWLVISPDSLTWEARVSDDIQIGSIFFLSREEPNSVFHTRVY